MEPLYEHVIDETGRRRLGSRLESGFLGESMFHPGDLSLFRFRRASFELHPQLLRGSADAFRVILRTHDEQHRDASRSHVAGARYEVETGGGRSRRLALGVSHIEPPLIGCHDRRQAYGRTHESDGPYREVRLGEGAQSNERSDRPSY